MYNICYVENRFPESKWVHKSEGEILSSLTQSFVQDSCAESQVDWIELCHTFFFIIFRLSPILLDFGIVYIDWDILSTSPPAISTQFHIWTKSDSKRRNNMNDTNLLRFCSHWRWEGRKLKQKLKNQQSWNFAGKWLAIEKDVQSQEAK